MENMPGNYVSNFHQLQFIRRKSVLHLPSNECPPECRKLWQGGKEGKTHQPDVDFYAAVIDNVFYPLWGLCIPLFFLAAVFPILFVVGQIEKPHCRLTAANKCRHGKSIRGTLHFNDTFAAFVATKFQI